MFRIGQILIRKYTTKSSGKMNETQLEYYVHIFELTFTYVFQNYYDNLPPPVKPSILIDNSHATESNSDGSGGAPSYSESAISESIPSTPEVMFDNMPPHFPKHDDSRGGSPSLVGWPRPRRLSRDSGAFELEEEDQYNLSDDPMTNKDSLNTIHNHSSCMPSDLPKVVLDSPTVGLKSSQYGTSPSLPKLSLNVNCTAPSGQVANCDNCQTDLNSNPDLRPELDTGPKDLQANQSWDNVDTEHNTSIGLSTNFCSSTPASSTSAVASSSETVAS